MRPFVALLCAALIIGSVQTYLVRAKTSSGVTTVATDDLETDGAYALEVLLTFDAGPDPFALNEEKSPAVMLSMAGHRLMEHTDRVSSGVLPEIQAPEIKAGRNECFFFASPAESSPTAIRAARIRLTQAGNIIDEKWFVSEPGGAVEGTMMFDVPGAEPRADE